MKCYQMIDYDTRLDTRVMPNAELQKYIESEILPRYQSFDAAHQLDHVQMVIDQSLRLATTVSNSPRYRNADGSKTVISTNMVYAIAAYHDTGLVEGRENHHTASARILREDKQLLQWFTPEQIEVMADAAEDHRASSKSEPRTIYGRIVAEKYDEGGYLKLWIPESPNGERLAQLRAIIHDQERMREVFEQQWEELI